MSFKFLKHSHIPSKKWFYNNLKGESVSSNDYNEMVFTHTNLYDLLNDYNNLDVKPSVEATKKLGNFFQSLNLDIHKNSIFVPRLTLKYLWHTKSKDCEFQLFKGNEELYHKYRDDLKKTTRIRKGKLCQGILEYDTNALYLWVISQDMPCGEHQVVQVYPDILKDVLDNTFFGMIECDIAVPEHLKECFAGMPPIFKNVEITCNDLSSDTQAHVKPDHKSNRLVESMFGETMMFATKLLKRYFEHGLVVSNIAFAVRYELKVHFKSFSEQTVKIVTGDNYIKNIRRNNYIEHQDMNKGCEFRFKKMSFKQSLPIHIRFQVYQLAKLRMLQFYYDSIDYSIDKSDYQYCMMDTDLAYIAISDESLEVIKPSLKDEFKKNRHLWLERDDTIENKVYDSRTPGLFKLEYEGTCIISLASKMYYCDENKFSLKGN
ncbi:hypothetical protein BATDEDRAFT_23783 [Batrachochytrium dendrobatidis JAM81]|uniref:DNA-directed DNA polymerase n=1 Tax=Batrachochytrium dendrobatidis (strain JAM81 / FGSC 10211) TaxID=684364 RepID=F4P066_BATDJ|nr:uncharacterized protein BATDEDRAFT_23783 [Batrachochytrium dendrobatidis JAM81]EGF81388.1 hypothetical protein BATDEDRAFT_23783 [Batrachochytrium dendrobatidis JAM81]|eukprot:XP_006677832.1 hypothetical protein BATDEDRAFT_23783 [Batrachochytrium dendrobatidis JAM81]